LRLALVTCPVALYSAHHDRGSLRFNLINPETGNRINTVTLDSETREEVSRRDCNCSSQVHRSPGVGGVTTV